MPFRGPKSRKNSGVPPHQGISRKSIGSWLAGDVYHFHGQGWVLSVTATVLNRDKQHHPPPERVQGQRRLQALPPTATYTTRLQALSHQGSFFSHSSNNMSAWFQSRFPCSKSKPAMLHLESAPSSCSSPTNLGSDFVGCLLALKRSVVLSLAVVNQRNLCSSIAAPMRLAASDHAE